MTYYSRDKILRKLRVPIQINAGLAASYYRFLRSYPFDI